MSWGFPFEVLHIDISSKDNKGVHQVKVIMLERRKKNREKRDFITNIRRTQSVIIGSPSILLKVILSAFIHILQTVCDSLHPMLTPANAQVTLYRPMDSKL